MPVAIITGASKGIGWSIANRFAENGFDLLMIARDIEGLLARSGELQQKFPDQRFATFSIDLIDKSQLSSLSQFALATLSSMDVLVLNAGLFAMGDLLNTDPFVVLFPMNPVSIVPLTAYRK